METIWVTFMADKYNSEKYVLTHISFQKYKIPNTTTKEII